MNKIIHLLQTDSVPDLFAHNNIVLAYLYGSQARDESGPLSDVDTAPLRQLKEKYLYKRFVEGAD